MERLLQIFSGALLPLALMGAGAYFLCTCLPSFLRRKRRHAQKRTHSGALCALAVALAGTLGVGNIAGVASAIALGGAGAVFWMWISALLAMFLKYAEVVLAVRTRVRDGAGRAHGGAPYYIRKAFGGGVGKGIAAVFAVLCTLCALLLGGVVQSAAAAEAVTGALGIPSFITGAALGIVAALVLAVGAKGVERVCTAIVPAVCVLFFVGSAAAILLRAERLPEAFASIFKGAFSAESAAGGIVGFFTSRALRYGVARGVVSNEAGCGTAPFAHAAAEAQSPAAQGLWGIVEVFVDTILLCTVTALVILVSDVPVCEGGGMLYALSAYAAILGPVAAPLLAVSVCLFAFATVLCWAHYGAESLYALTGKERKPRLFALFVLLACILGAVAAPSLVWDLTDLLLGIMTVINVTALLSLRHRVKEETQRHFR